MEKESKDKSNITQLSIEEAVEKEYFKNGIIIKIKDQYIDDILTYFSIEDTMEYLMLAPLTFLSRTEGAPNEKELKDKLWKQVRNFYIGARDILDKRYRL